MQKAAEQANLESRVAALTTWPVKWRGDGTELTVIERFCNGNPRGQRATSLNSITLLAGCPAACRVRSLVLHRYV
jgi:hypothetical protein